MFDAAKMEYRGLRNFDKRSEIGHGLFDVQSISTYGPLGNADSLKDGAFGVDERKKGQINRLR